MPEETPAGTAPATTVIEPAAEVPAPEGETPPAEPNPMDHILKRTQDARDKGKVEIERLNAEVAALKQNGNAAPPDMAAMKAEIMGDISRSNEITDFTTNNPDFKDYADTVSKLYETGSIKSNVTAEAAFYMAAGKDLMKMGADARTAADQTANGERTGGSAPQGNTQAVDFGEMSLEQIATLRDQALTN